MKKKLTALFLVVAVVAALLAGATLSYFTDNDTVTNTFTVGDVAVNVYETIDGEKVEDGIEYENVVPNVPYAKDPTIENKGPNDAYARMLVTVPALLDGTPLNELFVGLNTTNFTFVGGIQNADTVTYVFNYNGKLTPNAVATLFTAFKLPATLTQEDMAGQFNVVVEGQAIQADGFENAAAAFAALDGESNLGAITNTYPTTAAELEAALAAGGNVVLMKDVVVDEMLTVDAPTTLNMNGKTLSNTTDIWNDETGAWSLISVRGANANLTLTGNGTFKAKENDSFAIDLQGGAKCTIKDGTYIGNINAVYVYAGELTVEGGTFDIQQLNSAARPYDFVLNCYDPSYKDGIAKITVTGGTFHQFNPSNAKCESPIANFVPAGKTVTESDGWYTVR